MQLKIHRNAVKIELKIPNKVKGGLEAWVTAGSNALYTATEGWAYICTVKVGIPPLTKT